MFLCRQCKEQFEDDRLAYTLILEARENFPAADMFVSKFCSRAHLQEFLDRIHFQEQHYVLTKVGKENKRFDPAAPLDLLLLVGSSKGA
ncbi:MAG TPA: hypothetical protein VNT26_01550 [Candidatus Sulfotelmatobacter sp.]|nr:hypothetical protein [Candidatus Sulfotelmatobacter sp.]